MLISVVIPVYNAENFIADCLDSIFRCLVSNFEVVIVDGESLDATSSIVQRYIDRGHPIVFHSEKDGGIYDAMNKGVKLAHGQYVYFIGADDLMLVSNQVLEGVLINEEVYYGDVIFSTNKQRYNGEFSTKVLVVKNICHQAIFYPRKILLENIFNVKYQMMGDYELNLRLWNQVKYNYISNDIAIYSNTGLSTMLYDKEFKKNFLNIIFKNLGFKFVFYKIITTLKGRIFK
jgi:glycosyltransferase involved in cell wall biosynthesis